MNKLKKILLLLIIVPSLSFSVKLTEILKTGYSSKEILQITSVIEPAISKNIYNSYIDIYFSRARIALDFVTQLDDSYHDYFMRKDNVVRISYLYAMHTNDQSKENNLWDVNYLLQLVREEPLKRIDFSPICAPIQPSNNSSLTSPRQSPQPTLTPSPISPPSSPKTPSPPSSPSPSPSPSPPTTPSPQIDSPPSPSTPTTPTSDSDPTSNSLTNTDSTYRGYAAYNRGRSRGNRGRGYRGRTYYKRGSGNSYIPNQ